jgi:alpha,alpha-trehalase
MGYCIERKIDPSIDYRMKLSIIMPLALILLSTACRQSASQGGKNTTVNTAEPLLYDPAQRLGQLFIEVQLGKIFPDGKTFADCTPKGNVDEIMKEYVRMRKEPNFDLKKFVTDNFELPYKYSSGFKSDTSQSPEKHIQALWDVLTRKPDSRHRGTLIPLPNPYVVPGGRFGEVYYWDSYFTMLGLQKDGRADLINNMIDNFAFLIDTIGFIPNGNRTYFLSRSQPPFFAGMVKILAEEKGEEIYAKYLPQLEKEYQFWMKGKDQITADKVSNLHVVRMPDGSFLNRYYDNSATPRAEMYAADVELSNSGKRPPAELYRDLRSACESGWDFSSRWLDDPTKLYTIRTTAIIPVDLNSLLYNLELTIAKAYHIKNDQVNAEQYEALATARNKAIQKYCWDAEAAYFVDYDWVKGKPTGVLSLAGMFPLFYKLASPLQAASSALVLTKNFLRSGGLVCTANLNGQQWDAPNGWAPLQWISIQGLRNYDQHKLADEIKARWVKLNVKTYKATGKMVEKYNVEDISLTAGGGEYPVQDGFGWTNGVLRGLLGEKPLKN